MTTVESLRLTLARWNAHEVIMFDEERRESWILYPPGSQYLSGKRVLQGGTLIERRRWTPYTQPEEHLVNLKEGCASHGFECESQRAIQAAIDFGWNPFSA